MRPDAAIARRSFRQVSISAGVWAVVFGGTIASSALTYVSSFPDQASRTQLAASTAGDAGLSILLGPVSGIDTVGGYVVYKCFVFLTTIGAVWGLLAATRLLRGEEDAGRWQLLLAGGARAPKAAIATLAGLAAAVAVVFVGTALITLLAGRDPDVAFHPGETLFYAASIVLPLVVFIAVGALTSQLGRSRRQATGLGLLVLGAAFLVRMIADSAASTRWLLWGTPFGWVERMRPFTDDDPRPLLLAMTTVVALVVATLYLAARRDAGAGLLARRDEAPRRRYGLGSPFGLALRLELPVLLAWCVGAFAAGLCFGIIATVATGDVPSSINTTLSKFGLRGAFVRQYFGVVFLFVATLVALLPASQAGAAAEEEDSGRLVHLLARPVRRTTVLGGRLAIGAAGIVAAGLLAGVAAWLGATIQGVDPGLGRMVGAGLNVTPTALVVLGVGAVVLAVAHRVAARAIYALVIASLLLDLVASLIPSAAWLQHASLFHYMALAPAQAPQPVALVATVAVAGTLCVGATRLVAGRDLRAG